MPLYLQMEKAESGSVVSAGQNPSGWALTVSCSKTEPTRLGAACPKACSGWTEKLLTFAPTLP
jgi:hypothetical protein